MSSVEYDLALAKKEKDIKEVLGLNDEEFDSLFDENIEELRDYFKNDGFSKEEKKMLREILNS